MCRGTAPRSLAWRGGAWELAGGTRGASPARVVANASSEDGGHRLLTSGLYSLSPAGPPCVPSRVLNPLRLPCTLLGGPGPAAAAPVRSEIGEWEPTAAAGAQISSAPRMLAEPRPSAL